MDYGANDKVTNKQNETFLFLCCEYHKNDIVWIISNWKEEDKVMQEGLTVALLLIHASLNKKLIWQQAYIGTRLIYKNSYSVA